MPAVVAKLNMPVELGVCLSTNEWKHTIVWIPTDTRPCNVQKVSLAKLLDRDDEAIIMHTWVQCYGNDMLPSVEFPTSESTEE